MLKPWARAHLLHGKLRELRAPLALLLGAHAHLAPQRRRQAGGQLLVLAVHLEPPLVQLRLEPLRLR